MNLNNQMYILFENMMKGYVDNNIDAIEQNARCWLQLSPGNPFLEGTPEHEEFFQMNLSYIIWARGDVNAKINRRKMISHAKALCALNPRQPYTYDKKADLEEKRKEQEERVARQAQTISEGEPAKVVNEAPQVVLGVVPEEPKEKKSFFKRFLSSKKEGE